MRESFKSKRVLRLFQAEKFLFSILYTKKIHSKQKIAQKLRWPIVCILPDVNFDSLAQILSVVGPGLAEPETDPQLNWTLFSSLQGKYRFTAWIWLTVGSGGNHETGSVDIIVGRSNLLLSCLYAMLL